MERSCSAISEIEAQIEGEVFNLQRCSIHDGPGIRSTVFLKGCPLHCSWCHNPEGLSRGSELMITADRCLSCGSCQTVCPIEGGGAAPAGVAWDRASCLSCGACATACPTDAREMVGWTVEIDELCAILERDRPFYEASGGGVTFSGGEPLAQAGFLQAALLECRKRGLHTAVDTCGFAPHETMQAIAEIADLVLFDLKHMESAAHREFTGVDNRNILSNLTLTSRSKTEVWIRIPLIPGFNDDEANIDSTGAFIASLPGRHRVFVLPYHPIAEAKNSRLGAPDSFTFFDQPGSELLEQTKDRLVRHGLTVTIGGSP